MRFLTLIALLLTLSGTAPLSGKTIALFNGRDLEGWRPFPAMDEAAAADTFSVTENGHLRIAGIPKGYLRTAGSYADFRLTVEWRWVEKPGNSGVLIHAQAVDQIWPLCIEAQLKHLRAGDIIFMGVGSGGTFGDASALVVNPEHPFYAAKRISESSEKDPGAWNRYEILAKGADLQLWVNGILQNRATDLTLTAGAICLQSEGAPIEFRKVQLELLGDE